MAKARKQAKREPVEEVEPIETDPSDRDFVMARLAAARAAAQTSINEIDEALNLFVNPDHDPDGDERSDAIAEALESIGCATRALESAEEIMPQVDPEECEPWDEDGEEADTRGTETGGSATTAAGASRARGKRR